MKISIITVCFNSEETIISTLNSVFSQNYPNIEHIIIDGGSSDRTLDIIKQYPFKNKRVISENDKGIYDAMNKGIKMAKGEIISILNSDDIYQSPNIISNVINIIKKNPSKDIFLGDVVYFKANNFNKITRYYHAKSFERKLLLKGLMPPHPASFIRKKVYKKYGLYKSTLSIAADFEMFLRLIYMNKVSFLSLDKIIVRMRAGGKSGKNLKTYFTTTKEIGFAFQFNKIKVSYVKILLRLPGKLSQFFLINEGILKPSFKKFKNLIKIKVENEFKILKKIDNILNIKNFILSGMNLAFLGYYCKGDVYPFKNLIHWPDGLFVKKVSQKSLKIPGRKILEDLKINKKIRRIVVLGNLSKKSLVYLKGKFQRKIINYQVPYGNIHKIISETNIKLEESDLAFITLPTPKQEQLAYHLARKNKNFKIICIGASIMIASGEEKVVPRILENYEFIWRLRTDTTRRIIRLFESYYNYIKGKLFSDKLHIQVKIIE